MGPRYDPPWTLPLTSPRSALHHFARCRSYLIVQRVLLLLKAKEAQSHEEAAADATAKEVAAQTEQRMQLLGDVGGIANEKRREEKERAQAEGRPSQLPESELLGTMEDGSLEAIDAAIQKLLKVKITPEERKRAMRGKTRA